MHDELKALVGALRIMADNGASGVITIGGDTFAIKGIKRTTMEAAIRDKEDAIRDDMTEGNEDTFELIIRNERTGKEEVKKTHLGAGVAFTAIKPPEGIQNVGVCFTAFGDVPTIGLIVIQTPNRYHTNIKGRKELWEPIERAARKSGLSLDWIKPLFD